MRYGEIHPVGEIRCKLHKALFSSDDEHVADSKSKGIIFYGNDLGFSTSLANRNGRRVISRKGMIETTDFLYGEIDPDDKVEYDGMIYQIDELKQEDDSNQKTLSKRARTKTIITVRS